MIPPPPPLPSPTGPWYLSESAMSAATIVGPSSSHGGVAMQYNIMTYSLERNHCALPKTKKKKERELTDFLYDGFYFTYFLFTNQIFTSNIRFEIVVFFFFLRKRVFIRKSLWELITLLISLWIWTWERRHIGRNQRFGKRKTIK